MNRHTRRTTVIAVVVTLLAALAAGGGVWLGQRDRESPPAATGVTAAPTPTAGPTTPQPQTMTVRVFFHERAPGPESDPGRVVPVSRTVPRSPKVATAALNELLRGPTGRERGPATIRPATAGGSWRPRRSAPGWTMPPPGPAARC
jgi:hypothetical protein